MTTILIDANNMACRAYYALGRLATGDIKTGMFFGFLRQLHSWCHRFETNKLVFCFDSHERLRSNLYPQYKKKKFRDPQITSEIGTQIQALKKVLLAMGFRSVFQVAGYEADDLIAGLVQVLADEECVIISSDHDLYQLLSGSVYMWRPGFQWTSYTIQSLWKEYGVTPAEWAEVKAIAGCASDNIKGVSGVGELTAAKYLRGKLPTHTQTYQRIINSCELIARNRTLVRLPYPNLLQHCDFSMPPDELTNSGWNKVVLELGIPSLKNMVPLYRSTRSLFKE